jgi:hypothetical protein
MEREESRRLEHSQRARPLFGQRHSRVHRREDRHERCEDEEGVDEADGHSSPPRRAAPRMERGDVDEREEPSIHEMDEEADALGGAMTLAEHRPEHEGHVHAREAEPLAAGEDGREDDRADESPEGPRSDVHRPLSFSSIDIAALTSAR